MKRLLSLFLAFLLAGAPAFASSFADITIKPTSTRTYSVSTAAFTTAASATDIATLSGNASNTAQLLACYVTIQPTVAGQCTYFLTKRSSANSGGTSTTDTGIPQDSADSACVSVARKYTANPTPGTLVGNVATYALYSSPYFAVGQPVTIPLYVANPLAKPITLRGTAESIAVNQNGVTNGVSTTASITWVWSEK